MAAPDPYQRWWLVLVCLLAVFSLVKVPQGRSKGRAPRQIVADVIASLGMPVAFLPLALGMPHGARAWSLFALGSLLMVWNTVIDIREARNLRRRARATAAGVAGGTSGTTSHPHSYQHHPD
jgi:hypothetical protein